MFLFKSSEACIGVRAKARKMEVVIKLSLARKDKVQVVEVDKLVNLKTGLLDLSFVAEPISGEC